MYKNVQKTQKILINSRLYRSLAVKCPVSSSHCEEVNDDGKCFLIYLYIFLFFNSLTELIST